jgi:hypothetical protein
VRGPLRGGRRHSSCLTPEGARLEWSRLRTSNGDPMFAVELRDVVVLDGALMAKGGLPR